MTRVKYITLADPKELRQGWEEDDFIWVINKLRAMSYADLIALCHAPQINLDFAIDHWQTKLSEEQIILALLSSYSAQTLLAVVAGYTTTARTFSPT